MRPCPASDSTDLMGGGSGSAKSTAMRSNPVWSPYRNAAIGEALRGAAGSAEPGGGPGWDPAGSEDAGTSSDPTVLTVGFESPRVTTTITSAATISASTAATTISTVRVRPDPRPVAAAATGSGAGRGGGAPGMITRRTASDGVGGG